jgi:hypothetical protein
MAILHGYITRLYYMAILHGVILYGYITWLYYTVRFYSEVLIIGIITGFSGVGGWGESFLHRTTVNISFTMQRTNTVHKHSAQQ